jgi:hypothetical protein
MQVKDQVYITVKKLIDNDFISEAELIHIKNDLVRELKYIKNSKKTLTQQIAFYYNTLSKEGNEKEMPIYQREKEELIKMLGLILQLFEKSPKYCMNCEPNGIWNTFPILEGEDQGSKDCRNCIKDSKKHAWIKGDISVSSYQEASNIYLSINI